MKYQVTTLSKLRDRLNHNLYCFGAGKMFDAFMAEFADCGLAEHIKAVADNHADELSESNKLVNDRYIPIISLQRMLHDIKKWDFILITTVAFKEVISQLDKLEKLKDVVYFIYSALQIESYDEERFNIFVPDCLAQCEQIRIPKIIHYCWFGKKEIPAQYRKWMETWKKYCPDYEIVEWNEDNYDVRKSRYISQAYDAGQWAFVSDYARIDIINEYGGVYLDTDVELIRNLDELLRNDAFCGYENLKWVAYGLGFGAVKHNNILAEIKEYYDGQSFLQEDGTLNKRACPYIQTEIMEKHGLKGNGTFQIVDGMTVLPPRVLCGMSSNSFRVLRDLGRTYAIHHYAASWVDSDRWKENRRGMKGLLGNNDIYAFIE